MSKEERRARREKRRILNDKDAIKSAKKSYREDHPGLIKRLFGEYRPKNNL
jgi:hypothetical protein